MDITSLLVFCVVFLLCYVTLSTSNHIPRGPINIPVLGNIPQLAGKNTLLLFRKWRRQYGNIFRVYIGRQLLVVLNGYSTVKEALRTRGNVFSDRPQNFVLDKIKKGEGLIFTSGTSWKMQRKFTLNSLQELGFGRNSFDVCIAEEVKTLIMLMEKNTDAPFNLKFILSISVSNVLCAILFGRRFSHDDKLFLEIISNFSEDAKYLGHASVLMNCFPFLKYLPGDLLGMKTILEHDKDFRNFVEDLFQSHQSDFNENNPRDFIDLYITEMKKTSTFSKKEENTFSKAQLMALLGDLLGAGTETSTTTLLWAILYFLHYPDVQEKCFDEIQTILGLERFPSLDDITSLPYTEATILETLRIAAVAPLAVPHANTKDVYFQGFRIPKQSTILINLDSIFHDSDIFDNPELFRPERFLDSSRQVMKPEEFIPFSCGRRICIGEKVAQMELFIFLTSMIQKFQFLPVDPCQLPDLEGNLGIVYSPKDFKVKIVMRRCGKSY